MLVTVVFEDISVINLR